MSKESAAALIKYEPYKLGWALGFTKLRQINNDFILKCWEGGSDEALQAFRGSYKSTSVIIVGIIRYLLLYPETRILIIRKTFTDAVNFMRAISKLYDSTFVLRLYQDIFGIALKKTEDSDKRITLNTKLHITPEANIMSYGITDSITGAHADVIICDDVINIKDKTSAAMRRQTEDAIHELSANIIDTKAMSKFIFLGTRWHRDDAWKIIGKISKIHTYPASKYWTELFDAKELEAKKNALSPFLYAMNYELSFISDESLLFQDPVYGRFDVETWRQRRVYAHIDAAFGGADYCALTIMSGDNAIGWLCDGHVQGWMDFITRQYNKYHCTEILLETNADKGYLARDLRGRGLKTRPYAETMNKEIKIQTYLYKKWNELIWDEDTDPNYMNQILDWKQGANGHDDAADSAASLIRGMEDAKPMTEATRAALFG